MGILSYLLGTNPAAPGVANPQVFADGPDFSVSDPAFAEFLRLSGITTGVSTETQALGLTAYYRACALISGTIAGLPLRVYQRNSDGSRSEVESFLSDNPAGPYDLSDFSWVEMIILHLLNHGESFLKSITNGGGELIGLWPIHPMACNKVEWEGADKRFFFGMVGGGQTEHTSADITQVMGMSTDGLRGLSPLSLFTRSLTTTQAGETAANRYFTNGSLIAGLVSTDEDVDADEAKAIKASLSSKMLTGADNAGDIAFINRSLKFTPWTFNNRDAQFLESRSMQVEEVARMFGLPVNLLSVSGAVSNWGTGVAEANLGLQKYVLAGWTSRIEAALRRVLPAGQFAEFDFKGLLQGSPAQEIALLIEQVKAGILLPDEARAILNRAPLPQPASPAPTTTGVQLP